MATRRKFPRGLRRLLRRGLIVADVNARARVPGWLEADVNREREVVRSKAPRDEGATHAEVYAYLITLGNADREDFDLLRIYYWLAGNYLERPLSRRPNYAPKTLSDLDRRRLSDLASWIADGMRNTDRRQDTEGAA